MKIRQGGEAAGKRALITHTGNPQFTDKPDMGDEEMAGGGDDDSPGRICGKHCTQIEHIIDRQTYIIINSL